MRESIFLINAQVNLVNILVIPFLCNKVIAVLKILRLILTLNILLGFKTLLLLIGGKLSSYQVFLKKQTKNMQIWL